MYIAIGCMIIGVVTGYFMRGRMDGFPLGKVTMAVICLLLFILGLELGRNDMLMENLPVLGIKSFVIAFMTVLGSVVFAWILYRYVVQGKKNGKEDGR